MFRRRYRCVRRSSAPGDRDRPIARIERIGAEAGTDERLERSGIVRRSTKRLPADLLSVQGPASRRSVLQALLDERAEER